MPVPPPPPPVVKYAPKKLPPKLLPQKRPAPSPKTPENKDEIDALNISSVNKNTPDGRMQSQSVATEEGEIIPSVYAPSAPPQIIPKATESAIEVGQSKAVVVQPPSTRVLSPPRKKIETSQKETTESQTSYGEKVTPALNGLGYFNNGTPFPTTSANVAAFNAMQQVNKEQLQTIRDLERVVANLTRENNKLHERVAFLVDAGLTPDLASYDAYRTSPAALEGTLLNATTGSTPKGKTLVSEESLCELRYLKTRVRRLEGALQMEMLARENIELKCAAQQTVLAQLVAKQQEELARY